MPKVMIHKNFNSPDADGNIFVDGSIKFPNVLPVLVEYDEKVCIGHAVDFEVIGNEKIYANLLIDADDKHFKAMNQCYPAIRCEIDNETGRMTKLLGVSLTANHANKNMAELKIVHKKDE